MWKDAGGRREIVSWTRLSGVESPPSSLLLPLPLPLLRRGALYSSVDRRLLTLGPRQRSDPPIRSQVLEHRSGSSADSFLLIHSFLPFLPSQRAISQPAQSARLGRSLLAARYHQAGAAPLHREGGRRSDRGSTRCSEEVKSFPDAGSVFLDVTRWSV